MSQEDLIRQGLIVQKKQKVMQLVIDGKAILQALLNEATAAKIHPLKDVPADSILSHAQALKEKKEQCAKLLAEIEELQ